MPGSKTYIDQRVNYLGFLRTKLGDLRGFPTLVYELLQNADDVLDDDGRPAASRVTFDVCDDALIVENDGVFRQRDFDRMQDLASGGKREEEGTTGAFGIGFISVYQITDHPEIYSSGVHWRFRPEAKSGNIEVGRATVAGTRFRLPWAFDPDSAARRALGIPAISRQDIDSLKFQLYRALVTAAPFLKQIRVLELKRRGELEDRFVRSVESGRIVIRDGSKAVTWYTFHGEIDQDAVDRRIGQEPLGEKRRSTVVTVAVPEVDDPKRRSPVRLYATLPSEMPVYSLPLAVNADFYPTSDRKRIVFGEGDYRADWNRAAIIAGAEALAEGLDCLPRLLGHVRFWSFLQDLWDCRDRACKGEHDEVFAEFWDTLAPQLREERIIFTERRLWVLPSEARLLNTEKERAAGALLNQLGLPLVHRDLRPFFNLLRQGDIDTPLLSVQDIVDSLICAGLKGGAHLREAPRGLRNVRQWRILWDALDALLQPSGGAVAQGQRQAAEAQLRKLAIAVGQDGLLRAPAALYRGDARERALFPRAAWIAQSMQSHPLAMRLVPAFDPDAAIDTLEGELLTEPRDTRSRRKIDLDPILAWFEAKRDEVLASTSAINALRSLPMWPSSEHLVPLTELYLPSGFEDPLKLSMVVDTEQIGHHLRFLKDLGVKELTFETYIGEHVPRLLQTNADSLPAAHRRRLIDLIASKLDEVEENSGLAARLASLPLIECTDGCFYSAEQAYCSSDAAKLVGPDAPVAKLPSVRKRAMARLYQWLGVAERPRPGDLLGRLREVVAEPPNPQTRDYVADVFRYLARRWAEATDEERALYSPLATLSWLPGDKDPTRWYAPQEVYAGFQKHLFETQAVFLEVPGQAARDAQSSQLLSFLGVSITPSTEQVVGHLVYCCEHGQPVNREVYTTLNNAIRKQPDAAVLAPLLCQPCLLESRGEQEEYVWPRHRFWTDAELGRYRRQLDESLRAYASLLEYLGVRDAPEPADYVDVLLEISAECATGGYGIPDDETYEIVMRCWEALELAISDSVELDEQFQRLTESCVVPGPQRVLVLPSLLFFADRAGLAQKFGDLLGEHVMSRPLGAWHAMVRTGVRFLSAVTKPELVGVQGVADDVALAHRLEQRWDLLGRVVEDERAKQARDADLESLETLAFTQVENLSVQYTFTGFAPRLSSQAEPASAIAVDGVFYSTLQDGRRRWLETARELAYAIQPIGEIGALASGLERVLAAESAEEAERTLDTLGYRPLVKRDQFEVRSLETIGDIGRAGEPGPAAETAHVGEELAGPVATGDRPAAEPTTEVIPSEPTLTASGAVAGILGEGQDKRTPMPVQPPERPPSTGATPASHGQPSGRPYHRPPGPSVRRGGTRLVSYVLPEGEPSSNAPGSGSEHRTKVDQRGIEHVLEWELSHHRHPKEMPHGHPGYDIESYDEEGNLVRYIEVKSLSGDWSTDDPAKLTSTQFETARQYGDSYWLYVVERALSPQRPPYRIQNPAGRADRYLYDYHWGELAGEAEVAAETGGEDAEEMSDEQD